MHKQYINSRNIECGEEDIQKEVIQNNSKYMR